MIPQNNGIREPLSFQGNLPTTPKVEPKTEGRYAALYAELDRMERDQHTPVPLTGKISETRNTSDVSKDPQVHHVDSKDRALQGPEAKTLSKVERFFISLLQKKFFQTVLPKVITSRFDMEFKQQVELQAQKAVKISSDIREPHLETERYEMQADQPATLMVIPQKLFLDFKELKLYKEFSSHKAVAKEAVIQSTHKDIQPIETGIGEMVACNFKNGNEGIVVKEGQVTPTSYVKGLSAKEREKGAHLANTYVIQVDGKEYGIIRSGKIDTKQKADEFVALLANLQEKIKENNPNYEMRVVSQQLNSFEGESKLINNQHRWIAYANNQLKEKGIGEVVHINVPSNRWYHFTKSLASMGSLGSFLSAVGGQLVGHFGKGERLSKEQNMDSWRTYVRWVGKDLDSELNALALSHPELTEDIKELKAPRDDDLEKKFTATVGLIEVNKARLAKKDISSDEKKEAKKALETLGQSLHELRQQEKEKLKKDYHLLLTLEKTLSEKTLEGNDPDVQASLRKASLMRQVLGSQLDIPGERPGRGKEGMLIQLLNAELGVTSAINCKSGLDRTGFWHAVKVGMEAFEKIFNKERMFTLVDNWETTTSYMNQLTAKVGNASFNRWLDGHEDLDLENLLGKEAAKALKDDPQIKTKMRDVAEFRKVNLNNLIRMGIPITSTSTGLLGLKWNTGMQENLIPLNFLPSHIQQDNGKVIQLVHYDKTGEPIGMTEEGRTLLTKFQSFRGS